MNSPELPPASFLQVDLFPAKIKTPEGVLDVVRVLVTDAHVHVVKLVGNGDLELVYTADLDNVVRDQTVGPRGHRIMTAEGDELLLEKSLNCGCGMGRIKNARLYSPPLPMRPLVLPAV